jgi:hypothetical protein
VHHEVGLTSVNDAWQLLIACGASLASTHGIQPQDIILGEKSLIPSVRVSGVKVILINGPDKL